MEDFGQRARLVVSKYVRALSLDGMVFSQDLSISAKDYGGLYTRGSTIHFDPVFLDGLQDKTLAFFLAHELGHGWFGSAYEGILRERLIHAKNTEGRNLTEAEMSEEESLLQGMEETYADAFAIRKLFESGWRQEEVAECLSDCRSHLQAYFARHGQGLEHSGLLADWLVVTMETRRRLWRDFAEGLGFTFSP